MSGAFNPEAEGWTMCETGSFMTLTGPVWRKDTEDGPVIGMETVQKHANHRDIVHGGVVMTLADYGIGMAAAWARGNGHQVTAQLDVHFVSAAPLGAFLTTHAEIIRNTRSLCFARGEVREGENVVAVATGVWKAVRPLGKEEKAE